MTKNLICPLLKEPCIREKCVCYSTRDYDILGGPCKPYGACEFLKINLDYERGDEEKQITNGDAWKSYCEGQEVGFKKAEDVFKRMKLVQETVDCIRYTFKQDTESDKLVRNCMALIQNAIDGEYHDMEEIDVSELERPKGGANNEKTDK